MTLNQERKLCANYLNFLKVADKPFIKLTSRGANLGGLNQSIETNHFSGICLFHF
jgi:hypothetical protein